MKIAVGDLIRIRGLAVSVDDVGMPITLQFADLRLQQLYTEWGFTPYITVNGEPLSLPAGGALYYEMSAPTETVTLNGAGWMLVRDSRIVLCLSGFMETDRETTLPIARQVAETLRLLP